MLMETKVAKERRMDLFDLGCYFGYSVPVQARSHPLLKHAACAYAAKQLGRVNGAKAVVGGTASSQAHMETYNDQSVDWEWEGAAHYDSSILLLMEALTQDGNKIPAENGTASDPWGRPGSSGNNEQDPFNKRSPHRRTLMRLRSDEVVAATAILCVYEFLSATGAAWSRHLNGTKSLLDIAEGSMMPLEMPMPNISFPSRNRQPSKARRATFWNFARQDYLAACEMLCPNEPSRKLMNFSHK